MMQRIFNALTRYLETNRVANQNIRSGWCQRLQDIYMAHYQQNKTSLPGSGKGQQYRGEQK